MKNKYLVPVLVMAGVIMVLVGSTFAYWRWQSTNAQKTNVTFSIGSNFSCSANGGGSITNTNYFVPTSCTNSTYAIQRTITTNITNSGSDPVYLDMWLNIDSIDTGLTSGQVHFRYAFTTNPSSCTSNIISYGNFSGKSANDKIALLNGMTNGNTYYLYIWLDYLTSAASSMNQNASFTIDGTCSNDKSVLYSCPTSAIHVGDTVRSNGVYKDFQSVRFNGGFSSPIALKTIYVNNIVTDIYVAFMITPEDAQANPGFTVGFYTLQGGDSSYYDSTKEVLLTAFGSANCTETASEFRCKRVSSNSTGFDIRLLTTGAIYATYDDSVNKYCNVNADGAASCSYDYSD